MGAQKRGPFSGISPKRGRESARLSVDMKRIYEAASPYARVPPQRGVQSTSPPLAQVDPKRHRPEPPAATSGVSEPSAAGTKGLAQPAYLTQIYGLQGVLAETVDGGTLAAQSVDGKFNPASAIKLATALVALQRFGPEHRFLTSAWSAGTIDKANGT